MMDLGLSMKDYTTVIIWKGSVARRGLREEGREIPELVKLS